MSGRIGRQDSVDGAAAKVGKALRRCEVFVAHAGIGGFEGDIGTRKITVGSPPRFVSGGICTEHGHEGIETGLEIGCAQKLICQGAHPPQQHGPGAWGVDDGFQKPVVFPRVQQPRPGSDERMTGSLGRGGVLLIEDNRVSIQRIWTKG